MMLYTIQGDGYHFDTGTFPNGHQVLVGIQLPEIAAVEFGANGDFISLSTTRIGDGTTVPSLYDEEVESSLDRWKRDTEFMPGKIAVAKFFITDRWIGIEDLPDHYTDFLTNPEAYSPDDASFYRKLIEEWQSRGAYVLYFNEDYYMSGDGELESS